MTTFPQSPRFPVSTTARTPLQRRRPLAPPAIPDEAIAAALRSFPGVPHRIEQVRELHHVRYVNDSKATNVAAALRAIAALRSSPLHVILGGLGKNESYLPLAGALDRGDRAYLIGTAAHEIAEVLGEAEIPYVPCVDLAVAVSEAHSAAAPGHVVLLSPACASFDQFRDFEARGDEFRRLVEELT